MSNSKTFNELAGKIVNVGELGVELVKNGLPADYELSQVTAMEKMDDLSDEDVEIFQEASLQILGLSFYPMAVIEKAEAAALRQPYSGRAMAAWELTLTETKRADYYLAAQPTTQIVSILAPSKEAEAFQRAVAAAPDRRNMVETKNIVSLQDAMQRIQTLIAAHGF